MAVEKPRIELAASGRGQVRELPSFSVAHDVTLHCRVGGIKRSKSMVEYISIGPS